MKILRISRPALPLLCALLLLVLAACSGDRIPEHAVMLPAQDLPDTVLGYVSWTDQARKPIHRVSCHLEDAFYVMLAEGRDFELRVGFWGQDAQSLAEIDFDQADSVELQTVDEDLQYYRYSMLRFLPEMGPVNGSDSHSRGKTALRSTSAAAVAEHRAGIEIDFEFSCSADAPAPAARS